MTLTNARYVEREELAEALRKAVSSLEWAAMVIKDIPERSTYMEDLREAREILSRYTA